MTSVHNRNRIVCPGDSKVSIIKIKNKFILEIISKYKYFDYVCFMEKPIISEAAKKRSERFATIKKEYDKLMADGGSKTAVIKHLVKLHSASSQTIYKAIKSKG